MRPIDKGTHPCHADGTLVVFQAYIDAAPYLRDRLGRYCSYCERKIATGLAVEHVTAKSHRPELEKAWENFLLACANCNSHKGAQTTGRGDCLWPDTDDTFTAFTYEPSGAIKVADSLDPLIQAKARALLVLVGLDKTPEQSTPTDYRHKDRLEQWGKAQSALQLLQTAVAPDAVRSYITAQVNDGYSIWATVFRDDPLVLNALVKKYPGTRIVSGQQTPTCT
jgi:uncharacterized protein (TIGR02646 family)